MVFVYPERDAVAFHPAETAAYEHMLGHQVAWLLRSLRDAQRRLRPQSPRQYKHKHQHQPQQQGKEGEQEDGAAFFPPPRALSPAYGSGGGSHGHLKQNHDKWCGSLPHEGPQEEDKHCHGRKPEQQHGRPQQQQQQQQQQQPLERGAVEAVVWKVREHIAAVAETALSIDLVHRPLRPVLDRQRSTVVEAKTLGAYAMFYVVC